MLITDISYRAQGAAVEPTDASARTSLASGAPTVASGRPLPLGLHDCIDGFNFALFSRHATQVELLLFEDARATAPSAIVQLDPARHRTGDVWHALVGSLRFGQAYGWRLRGPFAPKEGLRYDGSKILLDPYALAVTDSRDAAAGPTVSSIHGFGADVAATQPRSKCLVVPRRFDWQDTRRPKTPWSETVIYETHVRGMTAHPSSGVSAPASFLAVIAKIPYLRELGITAVELMPVQEFSDCEVAFDAAGNARLRTNYWGYNTKAFFAPKEGYATRPGAQVDEFKTMVRELHRAGIEVILDVVFNHTGEGDERGPMISFRGIDNPIYYLLAADPTHYQDFTGCGNTLNCNHPVVRDFVIDCLRHWVAEMQVDGFRFDLASVLGRDEHGALLMNPPLLGRIAEDPVLRDVKLIAEAWDAAGAYQVGSFAGRRWSEWNGRFRDDARRFWRGDAGLTGAFASRLCGSADLYQQGGREPINSINFVTSHDGFTLADLVSYAHKHNELNGEDNRDGSDQNYSANHGVEGPSDDPAIRAPRLRQMKNMMATLLLARGVPMILGGDEFARSQSGNNNAFCQDNEISWLDWGLVEREAELLRFVRAMIAFRGRHPVLREDRFYRSDEVVWFGSRGEPPDWNGAGAVLGCSIAGLRGAPSLCLLFNANATEATFDLPPASCGDGWRVAIDTAAQAPDDAAEPGSERELPCVPTYRQAPRSLVVLLGAAVRQ